MSKYLLGIDNGLSVIKAAIFDLNGNEIAVSGKNTCIVNKDGFSEIDMKLLWKNSVYVIKDVMEKSGINPSDKADYITGATVDVSGGMLMR